MADWAERTAETGAIRQFSLRFVHQRPFEGQTPDELFSGIGGEVAKKLAEARKTAREKRMKENRDVRCGVCLGETGSRSTARTAIQSAVAETSRADPGLARENPAIPRGFGRSASRSRTGDGGFGAQ